MGCSHNSPTTRFPAFLGDPLQVKKGTSHSRSHFLGHAESYAARIANQTTDGEVVVSPLVHEFLGPTGEFGFGDPRAVESRNEVPQDDAACTSSLGAVRVRDVEILVVLVSKKQEPSPILAFAVAN